MEDLYLMNIGGDLTHIGGPRYAGAITGFHTADGGSGDVTGERHNVDMGNVSVPHFGIHLDAGVFKSLKERLIQKNIKFIDEPYVRFKDEPLEQETMFIEDPNGNVLEIKTMANPDELFNQ